MRYAMCPHCGRKICRGEPGTNVELECPKCGQSFAVIINDDELRICEKQVVPSAKAVKQQA